MSFYLINVETIGKYKIARKKKFTFDNFYKSVKYKSGANSNRKVD